MTMHILARIPHIAITGVLFVGPLLHYLGVHNFAKNTDLIAMPTMMGMDPFPDVPTTDASGWTPFFLNICLAMGALYAKVALTGDIELARNLCIARSTIALANFLGMLGQLGGYGKLPSAFWAVTIIEAATVGLVLALLPDAPKGKRA